MPGPSAACDPERPFIHFSCDRRTPATARAHRHIMQPQIDSMRYAAGYRILRASTVPAINYRRTSLTTVSCFSWVQCKLNRRFLMSVLILTNDRLRSRTSFECFLIWSQSCWHHPRSNLYADRLPYQNMPGKHDPHNTHKLQAMIPGLCVSRPRLALAHDISRCRPTVRDLAPFSLGHKLIN